MATPRLIRIGDEVLEVVDVSPAGSMFLLNRSGLIRRRIEALERDLGAARAELEAVHAEAGGFDGRGIN